MADTGSTINLIRDILLSASIIMCFITSTHTHLCIVNIVIGSVLSYNNYHSPVVSDDLW